MSRDQTTASWDQRSASTLVYLAALTAHATAASFPVELIFKAEACHGLQWVTVRVRRWFDVSDSSIITIAMDYGSWFGGSDAWSWQNSRNQTSTTSWQATSCRDALVVVRASWVSTEMEGYGGSVGRAGFGISTRYEEWMNVMIMMNWKNDRVVIRSTVVNNTMGISNRYSKWVRSNRLVEITEEYGEQIKGIDIRNWRK